MSTSTVRPPLEVMLIGARGDEFERACGRRIFPVTTPNPIPVELPDKPLAFAYLVDWQRLEPRVLARIVAHLATKFKVRDDELLTDIQARGLPILAEDCTLVLNDPLRRI